MPTIELSDAEVFTLQAAVEHLRSVSPDVDDAGGRERRADAAFRIAYNIERIAKRAFRPPVDQVSNLVREAALSRAREIEAAIERFRECGVELARFSIVERDGVTYLCVDAVARFSWQIRWPDMGKTLR